MSSAIVLDTETTGLDEPEVIQLAFTEWCNLQYSEEPTMTYMFKPSKPISYGAMATHHILLSDLEHADPWPGSWQVPPGIEYIIGHKIDFDWKAIGSPNVKRICTLALARSIWPDLDSHQLGALTITSTTTRRRA